MYVINSFFQNIILNKSSFENSNNLKFINSLNKIPENKVNNKINSSTNKIQIKTNITENQIKQNKTNTITKQNVIKSNSTVINKATKTAQLVQKEWKIVIPSIELEAIIAEGTTSEVMNKFVGHFEITSKWNGNVALAAHNRGYPVNYFANIKNMKKGDYIEYYWNGEKRVYKVDIITKIKDTDWTYLENTPDNRITLITCVENEPEYRRCIQATQVI